MPKNAIADLYKTVNKYYEQATAYLNPIGKVYLKIVFVFRVLFIVVFLDDVFQREPKLKCETAQIGCELSCRNRFAPISHMQIWQLELFVSMLTTMVFGFFKAVQNHEFRRFKRRHPTDEEFAAIAEEYGSAKQCFWWYYPSFYYTCEHLTDPCLQALCEIDGSNAAEMVKALRELKETDNNFRQQDNPFVKFVAGADTCPKCYDCIPASSCSGTAPDLVMGHD